VPSGKGRKTLLANLLSAASPNIKSFFDFFHGYHVRMSE
jgi:hypothetical protein